MNDETRAKEKIKGNGHGKNTEGKRKHAASHPEIRGGGERGGEFRPFLSRIYHFKSSLRSSKSCSNVLGTSKTHSFMLLDPVFTDTSAP